MERKTVLLYGGIVIVGLALMVGVVLFLRARNAPSTGPVLGSAVQTGAPSTQQGVPKFVPLDQEPHSPQYQPGSTLPPAIPRPQYPGFTQSQP